MIEISHVGRTLVAWDAWTPEEKAIVIESLKNNMNQKEEGAKLAMKESEQDLSYVNIAAQIISSMADDIKLLDRLYPLSNGDVTFTFDIPVTAFDLNDVQGLIDEAHHDALVDEYMVTKVYEDGEVTHQKGGAEYGKTIQHQRQRPIAGFKLNGVRWPLQDDTGRGFAIASDRMVWEVRRKMMEILISMM